MHTMTANQGIHHHNHHGFRPLGWLAEAFATRRQRARLEDLDEHLLRDIGIDRAIAHEEATRPFWDLP